MGLKHQKGCVVVGGGGGDGRRGKKQFNKKSELATMTCVCEGEERGQVLASTRIMTCALLAACVCVCMSLLLKGHMLL